MDLSGPYVESIYLSAEILDVDGNSTDLTEMTLQDWRIAQRNDPGIGPVMDYVIQDEQSLLRHRVTHSLRSLTS